MRYYFVIILSLVVLTACKGINVAEIDGKPPVPGPYILFGQPDFISRLANQGLGAPTDSTLYRPYGNDVNADMMLVADNSNNRVIVKFNISNETTVSGNEVPFRANIILGQSTTTTRALNNGMAVGPTGMNNPSGASTDGTNICVADRANHRIMLWNSLPTTHGQAADVVLGQPLATSNVANNGGLSASSMWGPNDCKIRNGKLYVADLNNNRILIWDSVPTSNVPADHVLGQPDFVTNTVVWGPKTIPFPYLIDVRDNLVLVASLNHRQVRGFHLTAPITDNPDATFVIGQPDFTGITWNGATPFSETFMREPVGVTTDGTRIAISDWRFSRVLIWDQIPTTNGAPADRIIGQPDFVSSAINNGGLSRDSLANDVLGLSSYSDKLYISDGANHRILTKSWETLE